MTDWEKAFKITFKLTEPRFDENDWDDNLKRERSKHYFRLAWELQEERIAPLVEMVDAEKQSYWDLYKKLKSAREFIARVKKQSCDEIDQNNCLACDAKQWLEKNKDNPE